MSTGGNGPSAASTVLDARNLYRFYHAGDEETLALRGVSLDVGAGEMVAVTGPSGSGKSTLLACLAGLDEPDGGTVAIAGQTMTRRSEIHRASLRARLVGMLFQSNNLIEHLSVAANVSLAQRLSDTEHRPRVGELLDRLGIGAQAAARPSQLSGGESARAGLAVALANDPKVLLADEPTGELDHATAERVLELLREHAGRGNGVVVVTHSSLLASAADRVVHLVDGEVQG